MHPAAGRAYPKHHGRRKPACPLIAPGFDAPGQAFAGEEQAGGEFHQFSARAGENFPNESGHSLYQIRK